MIFSSFFASSHDHPAKLVVRRRILQAINESWVIPLVELGIRPDIAMSTVTASFGAVLLFRDMIDEGLLDHETAQLQLARMVTHLIVSVEQGA